MGDFEVTNFKFFKEKKGQIVKCCYFHFCQILNRNKVNGCSDELIQDLMILPLVPESKVEKIYTFISEKYTNPNNKNLDSDQKMLALFQKKFLKRYKILNWNISNEEYKTNNICESYHRSLNSYFNNKKLPLEKFIPKLISYIKYRRLRIIKGVDKEFCINKKGEQKRKEINEVINKKEQYSKGRLVRQLRIICEKYKRKNISKRRNRNKIKRLRIPIKMNSVNSVRNKMLKKKQGTKPKKSQMKK